MDLPPLHLAARNGNFSNWQLTIGNIEDKNPVIRGCDTPFHLAAVSGHLSVCRLIIDNIQDKNPKDDYELLSRDNLKFSNWLLIKPV